MLGHNVSDELINIVNIEEKLELSQIEGKLVKKQNDEKTVAVLIKKDNSKISKLTLEERSEMNHSKVIFVTIGSSKNFSEVFIPNEYFESADYEGRPFLHGLFDCYTLVRDYYKRNFNIFLPTNIQRDWEWWNKGQNLYLENAKDYSFEEVEDIKKHDILIMAVNSPVPNHAAIYLGEGKILHHMAGKFSTIQDLKFSLKQKISVIYRNRALKDVN
jgi:cell wall-associated NlpC family hydrolase